MSYGWATVFTLAAWFAGLVVDVNVRVGDLGLRTVLPVIVMGCCVMKYMESSGILSIGSYLRKMALDGYCLHLDLQELRRMAYLLQMCSNNLNQYAKAANENGQVYAADLEDLRTRLDELIDIGKQILSRLADL